MTDLSIIEGIKIKDGVVTFCLKEPIRKKLGNGKRCFYFGENTENNQVDVPVEVSQPVTAGEEATGVVMEEPEAEASEQNVSYAAVLQRPTTVVEKPVETGKTMEAGSDLVKAGTSTEEELSQEKKIKLEEMDTEARREMLDKYNC